MRIAYLILAHNTPNHLSRLINALNISTDAFFIHLDARSDISLYAPSKYPGNVHFIGDRIKVCWGEFSMVKATLLLLQAALTSDYYDYCILLSGSDYPIVQRHYIHKYLLDNYGQEFINVVTLPNIEVNKKLERMNCYHLQHNIDNKVINTLIDYANTICRIINYKRDHTKVFKGMRVCAGSQWWALTGKTCHYLVNYIQENTKIVNFYKNTLYPDESIFQTIIANSMYRERIRRNLTYADWVKFGPPFPATINQWHINFINSNPQFCIADVYGNGQVLFARKFPDDSEELVNSLCVGGCT